MGRPFLPKKQGQKIVQSRRTFLIGLATTIGTRAHAGRATNVLFVCQAGTAKSAIAREFLRRRARERGIAVTTFSRGIVIEDHLSDRLRKSLAAEGIDPTRDGARALVSSDIAAADIVVAFTPLPSGVDVPSQRDWRSLPSVNDAWSSARPELIRRIDALLDEIAGRPGIDR